MKPTNHIVLVSLLAALTAQAEGADAPTDTAAPRVDGERPAEQSSGDAAPSPEVFVPTEEISEDFAVSFPVDI
jgi:hypothetical protein